MLGLISKADNFIYNGLVYGLLPIVFMAFLLLFPFFFLINEGFRSV